MVKINKVQAKKYMNAIGIVAGIAALVVAGVLGTLSYQNTISNIKAEGVREYQVANCNEYTHKFEDGSAKKWLECDE